MLYDSDKSFMLNQHIVLSQFKPTPKLMHSITYSITRTLVGCELPVV